MSHPNDEDLDRMVLLFSNQQGTDRFFIEVPDGSRYHFHRMCIMDWLIAA
jgi:hypothetical protein